MLYSTTSTHVQSKITPKRLLEFISSPYRTIDEAQGLGDLRSGIIRTPLPPKETFTDDPLRVIRCIRFASRFGFSMVTELQDAASHPDIKVCYSASRSCTLPKAEKHEWHVACTNAENQP